MCGGSAGVRRCVACPSSLLDLPCGAACAVLLRAGCSRPWGRVGVPPILGHTGGGVHFPGPFGTRLWRVFGVWLRRFWADLSDVSAGALVQTNAVRYGVARTGSLLVGAAHTRAVMRIITAHLCDCERGRGRMCRAWACTSSRAYQRLARLTTRTNAIVNLLCQINQFLGISSAPSVSNRPLSHLLRRKNDPLVM